jgi:hypothetical protein
LYVVVIARDVEFGDSPFQFGWIDGRNASLHVLAHAPHTEDEHGFPPEAEVSPAVTGSTYSPPDTVTRIRS